MSRRLKMIRFLYGFFAIPMVAGTIYCLDAGFRYYPVFTGLVVVSAVCTSMGLMAASEPP